MMPATIVSPRPPLPSSVDERPVDLHDVDGKPAQVAERRVAGAEVVDREPDAGVLERLERGDAPRSGVLEQRALGDLEAQPASGRRRCSLRASRQIRSTRSGCASSRGERFTDER